MKKHVLPVVVLVTLAILTFIHYKIKPEPSEKELNEYAQGMGDTTQWRGQIAPDFEIETMDGQRFKLSDNVGKKIVVLNFFATWCNPCRDEMPELNTYYNDHKGQPFLLLGIDSEEKQDRVESFLSDLKIDFPVGIDDGPIEKQYGVSAYPTTVVIGVDGKVQFYETGELANADVAFDNLVQQNLKLMSAGRVISTDDYRLQAQKQPALPVRQYQNDGASQTDSSQQEYKLDERGKRIAAKMACPCGCDKKVADCSCATATKIKKALATEDFKNQSDDEIIKALNKRFCMGGM